MFHSKIRGAKFFISSDFHINHFNINKATTTWDRGYRDFESLEAMNDTIIENINKTVPPEAHFFILGDVIFQDKTLLPAYMNRINCKNCYLIFGNHDTTIRKKPELLRNFKWCGDYLEIFVGGIPIVLSHYPFATWNFASEGSWNLFGHHHGNLPDNTERLSLDVGVDTTWYGHKQYTPYSFSELVNIMKQHKIPTKSEGDHH